MDRLLEKIYRLYLKQLNNLNIGYDFDSQLLCEILDLINAIDYIENAEPTNSEILKIISYYG